MFTPDLQQIVQGLETKCLGAEFTSSETIEFKLHPCQGMFLIIFYEISFFMCRQTCDTIIRALEECYL